MGSRRLTLLRHGQAQPAEGELEDFERALTRRGTVEAKEMAMRIVYRHWIPDLILTSPAERAWATAKIVARACELDAKQVLCERTLYLAGPETVWRLLKRRDSGVHHVLVCGHNPGLSEVASRFGPRPQARELPTAGLATAVWHDGHWATIKPEAADNCELDDPESLADLWV